MNFHWIPVTDDIYSLEHSVHSLLRLNEITFNALISQPRPFIWVSPSGLSLCGWMCLPGLGSVKQPLQSLSRQCFPKAALCVVACLCWCCWAHRGQENVLTQCFLWLVAARGLTRGITCKSPVQRQCLRRRMLEVESLLRMRSLKCGKSQMKLLATLRYCYQKAIH